VWIHFRINQKNSAAWEGFLFFLVLTLVLSIIVFKTIHVVVDAKNSHALPSSESAAHRPAGRIGGSEKNYTLSSHISLAESQKQKPDNSKAWHKTRCQTRSWSYESGVLHYAAFRRLPYKGINGARGCVSALKSYCLIHMKPHSICFHFTSLLPLVKLFRCYLTPACMNCISIIVQLGTSILH